MVDFFAVYLVIMLGVATVKAVPSPNKSNKSLLCMVGSQRCVADSQSDTKALFETCVQEKADSILAGLKSLYDGASANLTGLQREKEKLLEEKNILIRSYSSSDEETREISPVSDGSLKQQEIDSTIEKTKKYLFRTERWGCVTIIKKRTAITFAHNEHRTLEVGNIIKTFSIEKDSQYDLKVRKVNIESDWVLLEADVDLCEEGPI
ncbi:hypothetical protein BATDEDRAFT_88204 [Batrachochytrium dendrobatidis JAM81]|uniref:Uncharacterized protein n=1 Tax=Batrachochytrium dendrobatidis (strain JAM81 / FGSC 10211) TaxID=684364 RepID=F4P139_BATDJ|nr:uncharacterized protein BATDEDRAFT_88204 [Batrachochytrium dendrobatidis JAM81]EGF80983.1 hypothetical protein BATDEDRAFT_88204 [Batrachochytrium dendrobatidis JAM81]|eukprot:XP_006678774.1 hypothetical protein BATDEDRAFT_88204 [Batrachochytrium dendrobatidis JAM81]